MSTRVWLRRAYETPTHNDGRRVLIDRMWPRGIAKTDADIDDWLRELAPSDELRRWFGHDPERWTEFEQRYRAELDDHDELVERLVDWTRRGRVTLVFAARDEVHNNAVVLRKVVEERRAASTPT